MVFRGNRREMVFIDHDKKSSYVIDEATMKEIAAKVNEAMPPAGYKRQNMLKGR